MGGLQTENKEMNAEKISMWNFLSSADSWTELQTVLCMGRYLLKETAKWEKNSSGQR